MVAQNNTSSTPTPADIAYLFLQYARDDFSAVQNNTLPLSNSGGSTYGTWDVPVQDYAAWATSIDLLVTVPFSVTVGSTSSYTWSPYFPYNLLNVSLLIGGSESIPPVSLVPFWIDEITSRHDGYDPFNYGPSNPVAGVTIPAVWLDDGSSVSTGAGSPAITLNSITPGAAYNTAGTTNYTVTFYARILLGRNLYARIKENLAGCVPLGDPSSRPLLNVRVGQLVGTQPENNAIVNVSGTVTATTQSGTAGTVRAIWRSKTLDQLPPSLQAGIPTPNVMMALELDTNAGFSIQNAGQFAKPQIRTAMIYHKRLEVLVNSQLPVDADYTGLWYSDVQSNARYAYDSMSNTLQDKFQMYKQRYGRLLPKGITVHDWIGGHDPEVPMFTPYRGLITPSVALANMANLKPYPAAETVTRVPSGTTMSGAYVTCYDFGLVPVSY